MVESVVIICDSSPVGKNSAAEAIRQGAGFVALGEMLDCKVIFMKDAVLMLNKNADFTSVGMDPVDGIIEMAELSDLEIYVINDDLKAMGMTEDDLIEYELLKIISLEQAAKFMLESDATFRL
ncbi:MAG: DsrE family protein [Promethearchaeota archaeon]